MINKTLTLLLIACFMAGCGPSAPVIAEQQRTAEVKSETKYGDGFLYTVEHDKHWFILEGRYSKGAMLHHPDCPCEKSK